MTGIGDLDESACEYPLEEEVVSPVDSGVVVDDEDVPGPNAV